MCNYCYNSYGRAYNFNFEYKIKKVVNIAMYTSIRMTHPSTVHDDLYVVCRSLWRRLKENCLIKGWLPTHPQLSPLELQCFATGNFRVNYSTKPMYIELLTIIPDRLK